MKKAKQKLYIVLAALVMLVPLFLNVGYVLAQAEATDAVERAETRAEEADDETEEETTEPEKADEVTDTDEEEEVAEEETTSKEDEEDNEEEITDEDKIKEYPVAASDRVKAIFDRMSLTEKVTQLLMPDFRFWQEAGQEQVDFTEMNAEVANILKTYDFGGVILFAQNVQGTEQTARLTYDMQAAALDDNEGKGNAIPLLIGIDQEGGIVYRLGTGTALPGNMAVGATHSEANAQTVGEIIGRELSSLGINVDFAPSVDVNNDPRNPVIGLRSFSSDPQLVAQLGVAYINGLNRYNISGAAKHFPGHGDTATDSHFGLPEVDKSYDELMANELIPFMAAADHDVDMLMTTHILFPQIDEKYPATLSKNILTGIVRESMNYEGVIITDALNMEAISKNFGEEEATVRTIAAGADIALMPTILRNQGDIENKLDPIIARLEKEATENEAFMKRVDESVLRVLNLKEKRGILDYAETKPGRDEQVTHAQAAVGSAENRELERRISREAITVTRNEKNTLPFKAQAGDRILLAAAYENELPGMKYSIQRMQNEGHLPKDLEITTTLMRDENEQPLTKTDIEALVKDQDYVIAVSEIGKEDELNPEKSWVSAVPYLFTEVAHEMKKPLAMMSVSKPYDAAGYPLADAIVLTYGAKGMDPTESGKEQPTQAFGPNIPAGIEIIFGLAAPTGKLPVDIPALNDQYQMTDEIKYPFGYGLTWEITDEDDSPDAPDETEALKAKIDELIKKADMMLKENQELHQELVTIKAELMEIKKELGAQTEQLATLTEKVGKCEKSLKACAEKVEETEENTKTHAQTPNHSPASTEKTPGKAHQDLPKAGEMIKNVGILAVLAVLSGVALIYWTNTRKAGEK